MRMSEKRVPGWYVNIIESATGKVEKSMGPLTRNQAERVDTGASINLDHDKYHTEVVEVLP